MGGFDEDVSWPNHPGSFFFNTFHWFSCLPHLFLLHKFLISLWERLCLRFWQYFQDRFPFDVLLCFIHRTSASYLFDRHYFINGIVGDTVMFTNSRKCQSELICLSHANPFLLVQKCRIPLVSSQNTLLLSSLTKSLVLSSLAAFQILGGIARILSASDTSVEGDCLSMTGLSPFSPGPPCEKLSLPPLKGFRVGGDWCWREGGRHTSDATGDKHQTQAPPAVYRPPLPTIHAVNKRWELFWPPVILPRKQKESRWPFQ